MSDEHVRTPNGASVDNDYQRTAHGLSLQEETNDQTLGGNHFPVRTPYMVSSIAPDSIDLLTTLVATPSPSHQEADAVRVLVDWMSAHGLDAHIDAAGNAVGIAGTGDKTLVMLGHIDTFGGMLPVRREGDILHGRGTVDAKGPLCAFAAAAASARIPDGWRVVVIGAVEEECPTSAGAHYAVAQYAPHMCIIGEPSRWDRLTLGYKGRLICEWEIRADLAHSANPTASPAELAFTAWQAVQGYAARLNEERTKAFEKLLVTLHAVNTGDDGVHGWARMSIGFRLPPDVSPEGLEGEIADILRVGTARTAHGLSLQEETSVRPVGTPHGASADENRVTLNFYSHTPTYAAPRDTDLSRLFRAAIRAQGGTPAFVYKTGTSDMNIAGPTWGCPILAYGAGDSSLDHTPHEHINLTEYLRSIRVLTGVIESLA